MTREAFQRGDWGAVIDAHPLESHDPEEWLRYGVALLQTLTPGPDVGKQQQKALAFVQAQKEGASAEAVAAAQRQSVLLSLREARNLAGVEPPALMRLQAHIDHYEGRLGWENVRRQVFESLLQGKWQAAQELIRPWISSPEATMPAGWMK